ncbi:Alpha-mannosidase 2-like Protein [Tribolium castaneum]|uniref:Alpha-mannosidase n=1 Tax=Tribolium castaneum TaxID=7070 RepID=D6WI18_TRICA|nr:PREDICTED: lysosomal alpha-mannosidase [Tribolium castaneum]EEZ99703.1 Alpha-mannosidase 2-like Protein [Tribolium castaneum]|eukprot:XP_968596.1 PREDICTED: lysosomal alpha-mannosidase [Tribolium castaneum]
MFRRTLVPAWIFAGVCFHLCATAAIKSATQCGYQACNPIKDGFINVHLVPHTHDDVGWLKTVDQYFYGANNSIQNAGVQYIIDSVIDELKKDPKRKFIYVETAYFWKWWIHQHDFVKHQVKTYVNNGQLEFIGGAWTMNDEATTHYQSIIDQFTWGLRKLNDTFGDCGRPKIGWQIDPFGHSREMASIFAQLGFDGLLLGRIDYEDKDKRFESKTPEMIWKGSDNLDADIFTGVMYNTYAPPKGFCFDIMCDDEPLVDDKKSPLYNIERKVDDFFAYLDNVTKAYTTSNVIITMGEDFNYQNAHTWFKNLDKLIYYANQRQINGSKYNLLYSTPSCYTKAVHDSNQKFVSKTDDFFPYSSDGNSFWTGYFTSRPTLKRFERQGNNFLQVCKQLYALVDLGPEDWVDLNALREAMGVMQHHDAITGTEKQHVAEDYARILQGGIDECQFIVNTALSKIITGENSTGPDPGPKFPINTCWLTNTSSCPFSEDQDNFLVTVYNPLSRPVTKYVRLPVIGEAYNVKCPQGKELLTQLIPIPDAVKNMPGRVSKATVELIFEAPFVPPLGFKTFTVSKKTGNEVLKAEKITKIADGEVGFTLDPNSGLLKTVILNGKTVDVNQEFLYYEGFVGDNEEPKNRSSGAYIFRPIPGKDPVVVADKVDYKIFRGNLVSEVQQVFNEWITQTIRVYRTESYIEFDWIVGPIPDTDANGKEIITRFTTPLNTKSTFYTDSNGREMLKRVRNARPTWTLTLEEPVSGNYYPVTSKIVLVDESQDLELAVLTDRAQGGTSLQDGQLELMVHRNCLHDDAFGVAEALNETAFGKGLVARGSHFLTLGPHFKKTGNVSTAALERDIAQRKVLDSWVFISAPYNDSKYIKEFSGLKRALPANVQILTLEPWKGFSFLLRLEHVLEKGEDADLSQPAIVNLQNLFTPFEIKSIRETTLGANQWLEKNERLEFEAKDLFRKNEKRATLIRALDDYQITLNPMQIRTFVIEIEKN